MKPTVLMFNAQMAGFGAKKPVEREQEAEGRSRCAGLLHGNS